MNRIIGIMVLLLITVIGQSWADEPKYQAMTIEGIQQLLNKNVGRFTVSQQTVIANGEEKSEYVVSCSAESGDLLFYESQLAYCLNQHLAKLNEAESDTGGVVQYQTIVLKKDLSWSQFDFGRDQKVRDLQKEAVINRDNDQKRDKAIGGIATSVSDMKTEVDSVNSTNNWQNGALGVFFLCLGAITIFVRTKLRRRSTSSKSYGYGYQQESKPDLSQVKKALTDYTDKRLDILVNNLNNVLRKFEKSAQDAVDIKADKIHEALRLEFAPVPVPPSIHLDEPTNPKDIPVWENKIIPLPDDEIIEPEVEDDLPASIMEKCESVDLVEKFPVEICTSLSALPTIKGSNGNGGKKGVF